MHPLIKTKRVSHVRRNRATLRSRGAGFLIAIRTLLLGFLVGLAATAVPDTGYGASNPQNTIRDLYGALLMTMKDGSLLGKKGRYDRLAPELRRDFDLPFMARMAIGPGWMGLSENQKTELGAAFARYVTATYADNFGGYSGERLEVTGQQKTAFGTIVRSHVVKSDGEPVTLDYLLHQHGSDWQVGDVYLAGSVSQLAILRSQLSSVLRRDGAMGLIALLDRKTDSLISGDGR